MVGVYRRLSVLRSGRENSLEDIITGFGVETLKVDPIVWEIERTARTDGRTHWKHLESSSGAPAQLCEHLCKHLCVAQTLPRV